MLVLFSIIIYNTWPSKDIRQVNKKGGITLGFGRCETIQETPGSYIVKVIYIYMFHHVFFAPLLRWNAAKFLAKWPVDVS